MVETENILTRLDYVRHECIGECIGRALFESTPGLFLGIPTQ